MPPLRFVAVDLEGSPVDRGSILEFDSAEVIVALCDQRTGRVVVSMEEPSSAYLSEGDTAIKVIYGQTLALHGIATKVNDQFAAGTVTATVKDPTVRLQHRNLRYGHSSVTASLDPLPGIPLDGTGLRMLITDAGGGGSIPHTHIQTGVDTVTPQGTVDDGGLYVKATRGQQVYDAVQQMLDAASGFEVDWAPVDAEHPGDADWEAGAMVECRTVLTLGKDKRPGNDDDNKPVTLAFGLHLADVGVEGDAESMVNYAVEVVGGGQDSPDDTNAKAGAYNSASWHQYGIWESWTASGDNLADAVRKAVLKNRALRTVMAYGSPPEFVTVILDADFPGLRYPEDIDVGDFVRISAHRGYRSRTLDARIVQVRLSQEKGQDNAQVELLLVPFNESDADILFEEEDD